MAGKSNSRLGDFFSSSRDKGCEGLPLLSVTLNDGLVERDSLERRTETNLVPSEHLLVKEGFIAYNMMRVWQGALGRAEKSGLVSPAYIVLRPKKGIDSKYAAYLFKTRRMIYLFWAYSYGLTSDRLRLYFKDFCKIPVNLPALEEQQRVAKVLSTWDEAIATTEQLLANSEQQKKSLMQQLLTGKKRLPGFEGEWQKVELSDVLNYRQPTPFLVNSTEYSRNNTTPVLTAGKSFILGYTDEDFGIFQDGLPVIIFDDFTTASRFVDFPFKVKSSAVKILSARSGFSIKYTFEAMQMIRYAVGGHQRHWISVYSNLVIPMPSLKEQESIATVLSAADDEIKTYKGYIKRLKAEKKALMQQLLTGKRRVKIDEAEPAIAWGPR